jgi:hypothetical protein
MAAEARGRRIRKRVGMGAGGSGEGGVQAAQSPPCIARPQRTQNSLSVGASVSGGASSSTGRM